MARMVADYYGKGSVRLTKIVRTGSQHHLYEFEVQTLLGGNFEKVYTEGDNRLCVPTDTQKNTVYALAKKHEFNSPEAFGKILAAHFVDKFQHVTWAQATIKATQWKRIAVDGKPHEHAFVKATDAKRTAVVRAERGKPISVVGGVTGLEVLKSGNSAFVDYLVDEYTTLKPAMERIFATSVTADWTLSNTEADFNAVFDASLAAILDVFATHQSLGVQHTIYEMGTVLLKRVPDVSQVSFVMPNQHRILVNLEPFKMTNNNEIFVTTSEPYGLIQGTIARD